MKLSSDSLVRGKDAKSSRKPKAGSEESSSITILVQLGQSLFSDNLDGDIRRSGRQLTSNTAEAELKVINNADSIGFVILSTVIAGSEQWNPLDED